MTWPLDHPNDTNKKVVCVEPKSLSQIAFDTTDHVMKTHRIHGAGIYANIKGVYWWDPCYRNVTIYSIHGSYGLCHALFFCVRTSSKHFPTGAKFNSQNRASDCWWQGISANPHAACRGMALLVLLTVASNHGYGCVQKKSEGFSWGHLWHSMELSTWSADR